MLKYTVISVAKNNLWRRKVRSGIMVFFVFMLAVSLFLGTVLTDSMRAGLEKTVNRMGADIIVVPKEYEREMADSLFLGEMCSFTFDRDWIAPISQIDGIEAVSPQLYMESLAASCCSTQTQLIAFDPETDFIVTSWLEDDNIPMPKRGEMIIGHGIDPEKEGEIYFFDEPYKVVGQLEKTGTNYDVCVFMTYETAQDIMSSDKWYEVFRENPDASQLISSLTIRTEEGVDAKDIARTINFRLVKNAPIAAYTTNGIMTGAMATVNSLTGYSTVLMVMIALLVVVALVCIFTITINERAREFGILASLGIHGKTLSGIVLSEGLLIGSAGGLIGSAFSVVTLLIFGNVFATLMELPKLNKSPLYLLAIGLCCVAVSVLVSLAASLYSARKVNNHHLDTLIRGEEL